MKRGGKRRSGEAPTPCASHQQLRRPARQWTPEQTSLPVRSTNIHKSTAETAGQPTLSPSTPMPSGNTRHLTAPPTRVGLCPRPVPVIPCTRCTHHPCRPQSTHTRHGPRTRHHHTQTIIHAAPRRTHPNDTGQTALRALPFQCNKGTKPKPAKAGVPASPSEKSKNQRYSQLWWG